VFKSMMIENLMFPNIIFVITILFLKTIFCIF
jgi:hypothetical protein